ncbi:MAG TPA: hypothetical protein VG713_14155 [Pirellulales bacterium]|nr:hypothetical protein [Pirellulales bacterium]
MSAWRAAILTMALSTFAGRAIVEGDDAAPQRTTLIVVVGAAGEAEYGRDFDEEVATWQRTADECGAQLHVVGGDDPKVDEVGEKLATDKDRLATLLASETGMAASEAPLWLVLIGHGTFDGRTAAFNLRGPDVTATELAGWLKSCPRPLAVIDTTAASGPFLTALSAPGRVIVTATKSGQERNYARFGRFFARRAIDPSVDLDKDDQTSLFEAFLAAGRDTVEFYKDEGRIMTEHPLLDDNGDGRGVRVDFFTGDKLAKSPTGERVADGALARRLHLKPHADEQRLSPEQAAARDRLESEIAALRQRKSELPEDEYYDQLERLLVGLARLYGAR